MSGTSTADALDLLGAAIHTAEEAVWRARYVCEDRPTPCTRWDLGTLVRHLADSASTIGQLLNGLPDGPAPPPGYQAAVDALRSLASTADSLRARDRSQVALVALVGSYELTLHAWDVAESSGCGPRLDSALISALLINAPTVSVGARRDGLFDPEGRTATEADPELQLLSVFGRSRSWRSPEDCLLLPH